MSEHGMGEERAVSGEPQAVIPVEVSPAEAPPVETSAAEQTANSLRPGWFQRLSIILFVLFCFELGLFLIVYPWTGGWGDNYFASVVPDAMLSGWQEFWNNGYVRGAISGLGLINLWIAMVEVFRLFARRGEKSERGGRGERRGGAAA